MFYFEKPFLLHAKLKRRCFFYPFPFLLSDLFFLMCILVMNMHFLYFCFFTIVIRILLTSAPMAHDNNPKTKIIHIGNPSHCIGNLGKITNVNDFPFWIIITCHRGTC